MQQPGWFWCLAEQEGGGLGYLRSRHGELEPVCTSSSLSSLSAELQKTRQSGPGEPALNPSLRISQYLLGPPPAWLNMGGQNLPDDGVHGCNAFCHNEGLTVGHIVQGGA